MTTDPMFKASRDRILHDLESALAADVLHVAYGDWCKEPRLSIGGTSTEPSFEVIVRELPESVSIDLPTTCPLPSAHWSVAVDMVATGADLVRACDVVLAWADALSQCVIADRSLGGSVMQAVPQVSSVGTSATGGTYAAAISASVQCMADYVRNDKEWEAVRNGNAQG